MKSPLITLLILMFPILSAVRADENQLQKLLHLNREEESEYKQQRKSWLNDMFRTPESISWQVIEAANHEAGIEKRYRMLDEYLTSGKFNKDDMFSIVVGNNGLEAEWVEKGSNNQAGRIHTADIDFSGNLIVAASSGGNIWQGTLTGEDWKCLNNGFQIGNIRNVKVVAKNQVKRIIVTGNGPAAVWFTDDEGLTWEKAIGLEGPARWGSTYRAVFKSGTNEMYLLCQEWDYNRWKSVSSIYYSNDLGESFRKVHTADIPLEHSDIWTPPFDDGDIYYLCRDTLSVIRDTSVSFKSTFTITHIFANINQSILKGSLVDGKPVLTIFYKDTRYDSSHVYRSEDLTGFTHIGTAPVRTFEQNSFMVSYTNPAIMFAGGVDVWKSTDNAATWKRINGWAEYYGNPKSKLHADIPGIMNFKTQFGGEIYLIGTDGGLYYSNDNLKSVNNISLSGLNVSQYYSSYTYRNSPGILFLGSQDQGFQRSLVDSGGILNFQQTISGDYGHLSSSDGGTNLWSVYPGFAMLYVGAYKDSYGTYTWDFKNNMKNYLWMSPIIPDLDYPKTAYVISGGPRDSSKKYSQIWKLTHSGNSITHELLPYNFNDSTNNRQISAMTISPVDHNLFLALTNNGNFLRSEDRGINWIDTKVFDGPDGHYFYGNSIVASSIKAGRLFAAGNGYSTPGAFISEDYGESWTPIDSGLAKTLIYRIAVTPDDKYIFAATQSGPYMYIADENRWYNISTPESPDQTFWSVEYVPDIQTARFVTYGRGCWDFKISKFTSVRKELSENHLKTKLNLVPNPVSEHAELIIQSNKSTSSRVLLYDLEGRLIAKLYEGILEQGRTSIPVTTRINETDLPDGNYMLILISDGLTDYINLKIIRQ